MQISSLMNVGARLSTLPAFIKSLLQNFSIEIGKVTRYDPLIKNEWMIVVVESIRSFAGATRARAGYKQIKYA